MLTELTYGLEKEEAINKVEEKNFFYETGSEVPLVISNNVVEDEPTPGTVFIVLYFDDNDKIDTKDYIKFLGDDNNILETLNTYKNIILNYHERNIIVDEENLDLDGDVYINFVDGSNEEYLLEINEDSKLSGYTIYFTDNPRQ